MLALWFLTLLSCQYLEEQRTLPDTVTWDGYVLAQVSTMAETQVLAEGAVTLLDLDGNVLREGLQDPNTPGYWGFEEVPVAREVAILVEGSPGGDAALPELTPTVWRGLSPSGRASWLSGALYLRDLAYTEDFLLALEGFPGVTVTPLSDGSVAHLWGEPLAPEEWVGASLSVIDGEGQDARTLLLVVSEDGTIALAGPEDPVDLFIALDLAPGTVTLQVETASGASAQTSWPARGGDLLSAIYYALPEEG